MIDLLANGIRWEHDGREFVELPSVVFVLKCEETKRDTPERGPFSPP